MNVVKKLGIAPILAYTGLSWGCESEPVRDLEKQRDEMLEALIDMIEEYQDYHGLDDVDLGTALCREIAAVEKATGKTWEEVKELLP